MATRRKVRIEERPPGCLFDEAAAERAVQFFRQELIHGGTGGRRWIGKPFIPTAEQEHDLREIFGRVDENGNRVIRTVVKFTPKKQGKTEEAAAIALKLLFADSEPGAEVYGAASDIVQAGIVFNAATSMVRHNPRLSKRSKIWDSTRRIVVPHSESFYRAVTSKVAGKHGFNVHGVIFDELHTQPDTALWDVLTFGSGSARAQPLTFAISTAGIPGESPVAEMLWDDCDQILRGITPCPPHFYPVIYAAEENDPWDSEEVWYAVNPFLREGIMRIEDIRLEFQDAKRRPEQENTFKRLRLNLWTKQETRWIPMDDWDQCDGMVDIRNLRHLTWYGAIDLSSKLDLTALVLIAFDGNDVLHVLPFYWIPGENMKDRSNQESAKYRIWQGQRLIEVTEGNQVDYEALRRRINALRSDGLNIAKVAYDPTFAGQLAQQLQADGFEMGEFGQPGYKQWHAAMDDLETVILDHRMRHGGHPILRWNADCVTVKKNLDGMMRPVKPDRRKSSKRIDGIVAMVMAMSLAAAGEDSSIPYTGLRVVG